MGLAMGLPMGLAMGLVMGSVAWMAPELFDDNNCCIVEHSVMVEGSQLLEMMVEVGNGTSGNGTSGTGTLGYGTSGNGTTDN